MARWFVNKYGIPTTHDAYLRRSEAEWMEEIYVDVYYDQAAAIEALSNLGSLGLQPKDQEAERKRLRAEVDRLAVILGEDAPLSAGDKKLDEIDAMMVRGDDVDLSSLLPKGFKIRDAVR